MKKTKVGDVLYVRAKLIDIEVGEELTVLVNQKQAVEYGIHCIDKVSLLCKSGKKYVVDVDITWSLVKIGELGILTDVATKYGIKDGDELWMSFVQRDDLSVDAIKKRLLWNKLSEKEIFSIIQNISENKLTDTLISYYAASNFVLPADNRELYLTAKAMAETGEMLRFDWIVADKHCIGWVSGNETTMILVPIISSLGIKIPKVFSKAITSPAATWECVEVLMKHTYTANQIKKLVKKNNCCLIWGGGLSLAPADDKIIRVSYPLSMQSYDKMISSIMAKQYAMWINHCMIDIPVWPTAKVVDMKTANILKKKFEYVWSHLWMKMSIQVTKADQPIGRWVGAVLQVREVLRVLQQHDDRPQYLEEKALFLASKLVELVWLAKWKDALALVTKQLESGVAWKKMQSIIKAQWGTNVNIWSEDLILGKYSYDFLAKSDCVIKDVDMKYINLISRSLWTPLESTAWIHLDRKIGDKVLKWDVLYTLYAADQWKLNSTKILLKTRVFYVLE